MSKIEESMKLRNCKKQPHCALHTAHKVWKVLEKIVQKYFTAITTLHVAQIVNTEQLQH